MTDPMDVEVEAGERIGRISALLLHPPDAWAMLALAHGAGAGMRHRFMAEVAGALAERGVATLRYEFPYMARGGGRPDPPPVLEAVVRASVAEAGGRAPGVPLFAGGKSLGGRMTSGAMARAGLDGVRGLVFLGFPLHPAGQPGVARAEHLRRVTRPMLFLQGTRDRLAEPDLIRGVCTDLGDSLATLHMVDGADHGFEVLKRSGRTAADVMEELAGTAAAWCRRLAA